MKDILAWSRNIDYATKDDAGEVTRIVNAAFGGKDLEYLFKGVPRTNQSNIVRYMESPNCKFLVYRDGNELLGTLLLEDRLEDKPGWVHMWMMAVSPNVQKKGIGKKLVEGAVELCKANGYKGIILSCNKERKHVVGFYERVGFRPTGRVWDYDIFEHVGQHIISEEIEFEMEI